MDNNVKKIINSIALGDKEKADAAFKDLMRNKVKGAVDTKTIEVADEVYNVNEAHDAEESLYEDAINAILEDEDANVAEMSDEELEKILEDRFKTLSEKDDLLNDSVVGGVLGTIGKGIGKGIASRVTVSGRADRADKKATAGDEKIKDRERLMVAKEKIKAQKALRKAQKAAKRAGKPVPRSYSDAGIQPPGEAKEENSHDSLADADKEELDEAIPPLLVSILKTVAIGAGKALLKGLLDKAEKQKITPKEYDKVSSKLDKTAAFDNLKSADARFRAKRNPFERGTLAYQMFDDLSS